MIIKTKIRNEFYINQDKIWIKYQKKIKSTDYVQWVLTNCVNKFFNKNYEYVYSGRLK